MALSLVSLVKFYKSSLLFRKVHIGERVYNTAMILDVNEKDISPEQVINDYVSGMY